MKKKRQLPGRIGTKQITKKIARTSLRGIDTARSERVRSMPGLRNGGCGCHEAPEPYSGPKAIELKGHHRRHERVFQAVRMEHSPSGAAGGSFRIDEQVETSVGPAWITRGYYHSYPDFAACVRVAERNVH